MYSQFMMHCQRNIKLCLFASVCYLNFLLQGNGNSFSDCDVSIFEAFAIFCGLGIHNTQMYENACECRRVILGWDCTEKDTKYYWARIRQIMAGFAEK